MRFGQEMRFATVPVGGGERTRTVGLYIANVALYQLSYTPGCPTRLAAPDRRAVHGDHMLPAPLSLPPLWQPDRHRSDTGPVA